MTTGLVKPPSPGLFVIGSPVMGLIYPWLAACMSAACCDMMPAFSGEYCENIEYKNLNEKEGNISFLVAKK